MGVQKYDIPKAGSEGSFEVKYWSSVNTPVFGADGAIKFIIHHIEDVTEFVLSRERASRESVERIGGARARADRMEAEVLLRASEAVWVNVTESLVRNASGNPDYFVQVIDDITARKRANITVAESRSRLAGVVDSAMDAIISIDGGQSVVLFNGAAEKMFQREASEIIGQPLSLLLPQRFRAAHAEHILAFANTGVSNRAMGRLGTLNALRADGTEFPIEVSISQTSIAGEKLFTAILRDVTERKQAEDTQRLLLSELDHRVKNTLATVQAIALQTLSAESEPADFVESFSGRIQALGRAHGLLTRSSWQGADLSLLIGEQVALGPVGADDRITFQGPQILLEPQAALHLGLVLHELGTNARKYGALSQPEGRLTTEWWLTGDAANLRLRLRWVERNGPAVVLPEKRGFGAVLIERSLRYALGGDARLGFEPAGVTCEIMLPLPQVGQGAYGAKFPETPS
jgi:PAS domain S-box-containing protein